MTPERRNIIIAIVSFILGTGLLILILNLALRRPNLNDSKRWGNVYLQLDSNSFSQHFQETTRSILPELNRLGPTFILENTINLNNLHPNTIRIYNVDLTSGQVGRCPLKGIGRYLPGQGRVEVDTGCIHGDLEFKTTLMHEIGHALGMIHICRQGETPRTNDTCSPVGRGGAVMNTSLLLDTVDEITTGEAYTGQIPEFQIQALDIKEFQRVNSASNGLSIR